MASLVLEHDGESLRVEPGETLTFGRGGDLVVGAGNRHLHRVLGCFAAHGDVWFLQHLGRFTTVWVRDRGGPSRIEIRPGEQAPIPFEDFTLVFEAGEDTYELLGSQRRAG